MKIAMGKGARVFPHHYYWIRKAFAEIGHEMTDKATTDVSFLFTTDACELPRNRMIPSAHWTCHAPEPRRQNPKMMNKIATKTDVVFVGTREYVDKYKEWNPRIYWMPPGVNPDLYKQVLVDAVYDIGFCGTFTKKRLELLNMLKGGGFSVLTHNKGELGIFRDVIPIEKVIELYSKCRLAFNYSNPWGAPLNMRIFETLSMEKCLLTNRRLSEPDTTFEDRKHLVVYRNEEELLDLAKYYLSHDRERYIIGKNGREEVVRRHTWNMRAKYVVDIMKKEFSLNENSVDSPS